MDHLRSVYGPILDLQNLEETFLARATQEYEIRLSNNKFVDQTSEQLKKWGRSNSTDLDNNERQTAFTKYLNTLSIQLKLLSRTYQVRQRKNEENILKKCNFSEKLWRNKWKSPFFLVEFCFMR